MNMFPIHKYLTSGPELYTVCLSKVAWYKIVKNDFQFMIEGDRKIHRIQLAKLKDKELFIQDFKNKTEAAHAYR